MGKDPLAKQKLLSNASNFMACPACGYQGMLAVPIVYHDPEKELLLTFFPPDLNTPINEQEKQIGPIINRVMNDLPKEQRKAYLLQPQNMLTYQTLIEKILAADGITKEMLEDQQKKINLLEKLLKTKKEDRPAVIEKEKELIDVSFFSILSRIVESAAAQGDEKAQQPLLELQEQLFELTEVGKNLYAQAKETETALKALQEAGKDGLTREKLLEIIEKADSDTQISTIASFARSGLDYQFFQLLSEKIEKESKDKEKQRLTDLREKLLEITAEIDKQLQARLADAKKMLDTVLQEENIEAAISKNAAAIDEFFVQVLQSELSAARKEADLDRIQKLERIMIVIEKATAPPEAVQIFEKLLDHKNEKELDKLISENSEKINQEFLDIMNNIMNQIQKDEKNKELQEKVSVVYNAVLKHSMTKKIKES